nr:MAG TPA: Major capsid protein [Microviridae sp.]
MKTSIGKNTLGGGSKMTLSLRNYNRSTHDLSRIIRTTISPGTLVPTFVELVLPGDTFEIKTRCHTLTHPTIGPLFGSFKQQNDFFFCPFRLYNAMLHNNTLGIGLDMKKVKFPYYQILGINDWDKGSMKGSNGSLKNTVHPSSLISYLGNKNIVPDTENGTTATIKTMPIMMYYDIFKNYYANKQEENFYIINGLNTYDLVEEQNNKSKTWLFAIFSNIENTGWEYEEPIKKDAYQSTDDNFYAGFLINKIGPVSLNDIELKLNVAATVSKPTTGIVNYEWYGKKTLAQWVAEGVIEEIPLEGNNARGFIFSKVETPTSWNFYVKPGNELQNIGSNYESHKLVEIDNMRENILKEWDSAYDTEGESFIKNQFNTSESNPGIFIPNTAQPQCGLALKTYQSDININWINQEWIDGDNGINAITSVDTSGGSFTIDTLNLAKKVYDMQNRIATSDGTYSSWIQTVYTSGGLNHIETPMYIGGSSLEIEFQEVINQAGSEEEPLGTLAGRGVATDHKGGYIKFKPDEPGMIMCITSITPRVDYFQGNKWWTELGNMDQLHKPALDGIGFQDRLYKQVNASANFKDLNKSIGKQPAWIDYMTAYNETAGNFALIENEGWMCLNRIFGNIDTYTTYVQPHLYNSIFADSDISAQNFWVQIYFDCKPRRVMSAKMIPNP